MKTSTVKWLATFVVLLCVTAVDADVRLPSVISSDMVLQQDQPVRIWGWADAGEDVSVRASWKDRPYKTSAKADGRWSVQIPTPRVGGPYSIVIEGKNQITLDRVMVGEVWICSGQSNMEMRMGQLGDSVQGKVTAKEEIAAARFPNIRLFTVERQVAMEPQAQCLGKWIPCTPENIEGFSAVAYFFGKELHQKLDVPIGLINSSWGGTRAEAWTDRETLASLGDYADELAEKWLSRSPENLAMYQRAEDERLQQCYRLEARNVGFDKGYANVDFDASGWSTMDLPRQWESVGPELFVDGVVWFRKEITIPDSWVGHTAELSLGAIDDCDTTYLNGRKLGSISFGTPNHWQVPRKYSVPADFLKPGKNVIAVRVFDRIHAGGMLGPKDQLYVKLDGQAESESLVGSWRYKIESVLPDNNIRLAHANCPSALYNGMIHPLVQYPIRGAIWYQGESNHTQGREYRSLFPGMITNWRNVWGQGDFPFLFVQIAPYEYYEADSSAELREAQLMTLSLPNTGMAVITDISETYDIHPRNKVDVGHRLALWALAKTYGDKGLVYSGPLYRSMKVEDGSIRIAFDHAENGLVARGGELSDFEIAGADKLFVPAKARIDGHSVVVSSKDVPNPVAVRFGWSNDPTPNLFNKAGLPASPFRTDDW